MRIGVILLSLSFLAQATVGATLSVPGDHETIQAAVDAASTGDRIVIHAGVYAEHVLITGKNDLTVQGRRGAIIDAGSSGTPLWIDYSTGIAITGLTLRNAGQSGLRLSLVSDVDLSNVEISNVVGHGIEGSNCLAVRIRDCAIADTGRQGIELAYSPVDCEISGCEISDCEGSLIRVEGTGHVVKGNDLSDSESGGIHVLAEFCNIEKNRIALTGGPGIQVDHCNDNLIRKNRIKDVDSAGISVYGWRNVVTKNRIQDVSTSAAEVRGQWNEITKNRINRPGLHGIDLRGDAHRTRVSRNRITKSGGSGMAVSGIGNHIERNTVTDAVGMGIQVVAIEATLRSNRINGTGEDGICFMDYGWHHVEKNSVRDSGGAALRVDCTNATVVKNRLKVSRAEGLVLDESATGNTVEKNRILKSTTIGFEVRGTGNTFIGNRATKSGEYDLDDQVDPTENDWQNNSFKTKKP